MAVNIDTVYQKVLILANKEQRGYITPQEFNLLADRAQNEIFENYFHGIRMAELKPKNQLNHADTVEMIEEKLHPFHYDSNASTANSSLTLPNDQYLLIDITRAGNKMTQVNKSEISYTENNPLTKATLTRSVFVREDDQTVTVYPTPSSSTYNIVTATGVSGLNNDTEQFEVNYYKKPGIAEWAYVVVNEKALYNSNESTNFSLHASEEENLVSRILMLSGVVLKQPDIAQAGAQGIQMANQEQNS